MRSFSSAAAGLAAAAIASAVSLSRLDVEMRARALHHLGRTRYPAGWNSSGWGMDPRFNRHTGRPHEHKRAIARLHRQSEAGA
jgi:hypothetical protein